MSDLGKTKTGINITDQDMADLPMNPNPNHWDNKSPVGAMGRYLKMFLDSFRPNIKKEFAANLTRGNLTEEEEMDPEKSKSFLPTLGRALKNTLPRMIGGFISMLADLLSKLLGFFKVEKTTRETVKKTVKTVGQSLFSGNPGEGLQNIATAAAPSLMKGFNDILGLGLTTEEIQAASAYPKSATFTPQADVATETMDVPEMAQEVAEKTPVIEVPEMTQDELDEMYGVYPEDLEERKRQNSSWFNPFKGLVNF